MGQFDYDFSGWATRNNLKCSDGRTIRQNAFADNDGQIVPLVWNHQHNEPTNVLGHALLENRAEGVYTYCKFNNTPSAQHAKEAVRNGDITSLSIFANRLKQRGGDVLHGAIREVSLVYTPANPGAYIEMSNLAHGYDTLSDMDDGEGTIYTGYDFVVSDSIYHSDDGYDEDEEDEMANGEMTVQDVFDTFTPVQKKVAYFLIGQAMRGEDDEYEDYDEDDEYEDYDEDDAEMSHSDDDLTVKDVFDTFTPLQKKVLYYLIRKAAEEGSGEVEHSGMYNDEYYDDEIYDDDEYYDDEDEYYVDEDEYYDGDEVYDEDEIYDEVAHSGDYDEYYDDEDEYYDDDDYEYYDDDEDEYYDDDEVYDEDVDYAYDVGYDYGLEHGDDYGETFMRQNAFDMYGDYDMNDTLTHSEEAAILEDGERFGSLRDSFLAHADEYGIDNLEYLFPDARSIEDRPDFIQRDTGWVQKVMSGTRHTPFSRIKSVHADITENEARAKGYIKGKLKKDEVFKLLKRTTDPQTIYKRQKLDRDDIVDITDFDVVAWLKTEMRQMLDEELARAILVGDGRTAYDEDKISDLHIRPIWTDSELYTINVLLTMTAADDEDSKAKKFIRAAIKARKNYKGSGTPSLYTTEDMLTNMLLLEDGIGHALYADEAALARKLRVKEIVTVPVMENLSREVDNVNRTLDGIIVNLQDYNVGADKGGAINMFDDFDIDYNQQKYLIETRCSGALVKPLSAIAIEHTVSQ